MSELSSSSEIVAALAEELVERYRKGERPPISEYVDKHPHLADEIREVFPAVLMVEGLAPEHDASIVGGEPVSAPSAPMVEQLGDYRIPREVGRGGMGIVYEAEQVSLGRRVALKVLTQQMQKDSNQRQRFEREAKAAAKLHHTNIVPVFGVGEGNGTCYYVMQFIQGLGLDEVIHELRRMLKKSGTLQSGPQVVERPASPRDVSAVAIAQSLATGEFHLPQESGVGEEHVADDRTAAECAESEASAPFSRDVRLRRASSASSIALPWQGMDSTTGRVPTYWHSVANIGLQIAEALHHAHEQGILHRDVKPSNLLLDLQGNVWVTDFGLAKLEDQENITQTGDVLGTLRYMAPELFSGQADARSEVYSLGLTLYELLALKPAFDETDRNKLIKQVTSSEPPHLSKTAPAVPRDLATICQKCIATDPARRYPTAEALADDLQRWLNGQPIQARPIGRFEKAVRWYRRNPIVAASLSGTIVIFLAAFALVLWSYVRAQRAFREETRQRVAADQANAKAQRQRTSERWERYRSNIVAATAALKIDNVVAAREALASAPREHQSTWEWRYLFHQTDTSEHLVNLGNLNFGDFVPRFGKKILVVKTPEQLHVWDPAQRSETVRIASDFGDFRLISPDGAMVAFPMRDHSIVLWDVAANKRRAVLAGHSHQIYRASLSRDSAQLATCSEDGTLRVWSTKTGQQLHVLRGHKRAVSGAQFSPDGKQIASLSHLGGGVRLWNLATERFTEIVQMGENEPEDLTFNSRGDRILVGKHYPNFDLALFNAQSGKLVSELRGHENSVKHFTFSADDSKIASCGDRIVRLWDGRTGAPLRELRGHNAIVAMVDFSPDGNRIVTASDDQTIRIWSTETGAQLAVLRGHTSNVHRAFYLADGRTIVSVDGNGALRWWDARAAEDGGILRGHTNFVYGVAFHPDGERVASAAWDGTVRLWNATTGRQLHVMQHASGQPAVSVAFHPAGKLLASVGRDDAVRLWGVDTGRELHRFVVSTNHFNDTRVTFSRRGDLLACGSKDNTVHVWHVDSRKEVAVMRGAKDFSRDVAFGSDGSWVAGATEINDKAVRIWDLRTQRQIHLLTAHSRAVYSLAVSQNGKWLASGSRDGTVRLWNTTTWQEEAVLKQGSNPYGLAFSPDDKRLAVACADSTIHLWDTATLTQVAQLHGHKDYVHQVAFSPDGTRLVSASGDFTVRIWDTVPAKNRAEKKRPAN